MTEKWTRWQDWVALIAGAYAALSPLWTTTVDDATTTMIVLGVIIAVVALISLAAPGMLGPDGVIALLGIAMFVSPWVMNFDSTRPMAWTAWIAGFVTFAAGALALPMEQRAHREMSGQSPLASH